MCLRLQVPPGTFSLSVITLITLSGTYTAAPACSLVGGRRVQGGEKRVYSVPHVHQLGRSLVQLQHRSSCQGYCYCYFYCYNITGLLWVSSVFCWVCYGPA
jgi:hypothetical protein